LKSSHGRNRRRGPAVSRTEDIDRLEAIERCSAAQGEKYKVELLEEIEDDTVSHLPAGRLPRSLPRTAHSRHQLGQGLQAAPSGWSLLARRRKSDVLQRIYGTVFFDKKALKKHLNDLEEAKKRDHRRLGKQLSFSPSTTRSAPA
jgi:threonyl-tRNA synthetase